MAYPNTGSILTDQFGNARTGTSLSTNIIIEVDGVPIGAIQNININEKRPIAMIDEVGTDGHIDSVPKSSADFSGSCSRTRFDRLRVSEAFSRGFIHVHSQRVPFDIVIKDIFNGDDANAIVTTLKNVWISGLKYSYKADNYVIVDDMDFEFETIKSTLGQSQVNASQGGARGIPLFINSLERAADRGDRRGALDASGLINAYFEG